MSDTSARWSALAAVLLLAGCPDNPTVQCVEECPTGTRCDVETRECVATPRPAYTREIPGRGVRIASSGNTVFTASVDPSDGGIVLTQIRGAARDARLLATPVLLDERRLALTASSTTVAVAWRNSADEYELAWRSVSGDVAQWRFVTIEADADYAGSEDFDLAWGADGAPVLVFRDRNRTARALLASTPEDDWSLETLDDGGTTGDGVTCPETLRLVQPAVGVGFTPDVVRRGDQIVAAYYDGDCGDLRLARRTAQGWAVTVVDTGDSGTSSGLRGLAGRWPSLAFDAAGAVAISYQDVSRGRLMFAFERAGRFETEVVDEGLEIDAFARERKNFVGAFSSLRLDESGTAAIVYLDGTSIDLQIATRAAESTEWSRATLVSEGAVGFSSGQVTTADGRRYVAAEQLVPGGDAVTSALVFVEATR